MQSDQKNLILAIVLSVAIIFLFNIFFLPSQEEREAQQDRQQTGQQATQQQDRAIPGGETEIPGAGDQAQAGGSREERLARDRRISIQTPRVAGSINLRGAVLDDVTLTNYREELAEDSDNVHLLHPRGAPGAYYAQLGWVAVGAGQVATPTGETVWEVEGNDVLRPGEPVTLAWTSPQGLRFERRYEIDRNYMISVTQRVTNTGELAVNLVPYATVRRHGEPETLGFFILHEGPLAVTRETAEDRGVVQEFDYGDVKDDDEAWDSVGGWFGMTGHYWLVTVIPDQSAEVRGAFEYVDTDSLRDTYQTGYTARQAMALSPGGTVEWNSRIFAGAKEVDTLGTYEEDLGIPRFDWAIDFGWFWFFTRPFLDALKFLYGLVGNFGIAIILLTVFIKILFFPLANKSYRSMSRMKALQPKMQELKEQFGEDKQRLNQEMMALYRREKVNPAAGCLPILIQIPVFFALYKVLFISIEMRHAPFFAWIQDLSAPDPTSILNLFGLLPWDIGGDLGLLGFISIGVWPILMGATMWLQQKLNPTPPDPIQQKIFTLLPIVFTFVLAKFPAGLVIYWTSNNLLSIAQQYVIMRRAGVKPGGGTTSKPAPAAAPAGGGGGSEGGDSGGEAEAAPQATASQQAPKGGKRGKKKGRRR